jgi:DNA-binding IclR family transcriptional regulator
MAEMQTLRTGIGLLERLAKGPRSLRDLSEESGLARQNTYRLVRALVDVGWVNRLPNNTYALSARLWGLATRNASSLDVVPMFSSTVRSLADRFGETVHLGVYSRGQVIYVDKVDGWQPIRSYTELGGSAPAYAVATGKALLAHQTENEIKSILSGKIEKFTQHTLTDPEELRRHLDEIKSTGLAYNFGEWRETVHGVAVPIINQTGQVIAALGFSGPKSRLQDNLGELLQSLRAAVTATGNRVHRTVDLIEQIDATATSA